jgi:glycosyltransferase involved in cell wall biosynthesis
MLKKNSGKKININKHADFSEIPNIIEQHDILVFPSLVAEAFGRAALEACAAGKIVIASKHRRHP